MNSHDVRHAGRRSISTLALTGASLAALSLGALAQEGSTRLNEIRVAGDGVQPAAGAAAPLLPGQTSDPVNLPASALGTTADGRINPPASALGKPGEESPVGPVNGYVAKRSATGTKTNTSIMETPQSISVVGQEQIRATGAQTLTQALQYTPGIYAGVFGNDTRLDYFLLRGFVASDYGLYKDGLQLLNYGFNYFRTDPFGLERVEVLRGPSSILFGSGNPGGMVNQISKRPTALPFGYVEAGGDSFGQAYGAFDLGGPVGNSGHWFYRLTGVGRTGGTQVNGVDADRAYIAPALTYRPDGATALTILTSYQKDWTGVSANFLPYSGTVRPNASGLTIPRSLNVGDSRLNKFEREQFMVGYEFEHAVNNVLTLRQNARYSFSEVLQNSYIGGGYANTAQTQLARSQFRDSSKVGLAQVDTQAQLDLSDGWFRHTVLAGVDFKDYRLHDNQAFGSAPSLDLLNPVNVGGPANLPSSVAYRNAFQQLGFYLQDQVRLTDNFSIIAGVRHDFAHTEVNAVGPFAPTNTSRNDEATTYRVSGVYNFDWGFAPYVAYSTSFQPLIGADALKGFAALAPDRGEQIEAGFRIQPVGQGWYLSFAAFDLQRDNPPIPIPGTFNTTQLGAVRSRGVEAQFVANVFDGLNVVASVTHYDLEYTKLNDPSLLALRGKTPTAVPETFANLFVDYTIPVGELRGLGFGGGVRYIGRSFATADNLVKVPDYTLFDATVHYDFFNGWRAAITAANIGDKRFVSSCQSETACFYGESRRVLGSLSYKW